MAKIKAPLFSLDAAGTLDKNITYKKKLQDNIAQKYSQPGSKNPFESSPRQKDQRSIIRLITIHWQCMPNLEKLDWENSAKAARFKGTGYHYFLHMAQQDLTKYLGLVGYWSMNYNVGDKIPDLSGNGNHGTLSPIYPCDCPTLVDSFDKKHGKAALFNGSSTYVTFTNLPYLNSSELTVMLYLEKYSYTTYHTTFSDWGSDPNKTLLIAHSYNPNQLTFQIGTGSSYVSLLCSNIFFDNELAHWSFVFKGSTHMLIYKNSNLVAQKTDSIPSNINSTHGSIFLARLFGIYMNCFIDNFIIFNKSLSHDEIKKLSII